MKLIDLRKNLKCSYLPVYIVDEGGSVIAEVGKINKDGVLEWKPIADDYNDKEIIISGIWTDYIEIKLA